MPSSARLVVALATTLLLAAGLGYAASQTVLASPDAVVGEQQFAATPSPASPSAQQAGASAAAQPTNVPATRPQVDGTWVTTMAGRTGIPAPAVRAYANAQLAEPKGCDVGWTTLAGIGWVESQHGTIGHRTLGEDGHSSKPILGPALDGHGVAAIPATPESTAWHGDPTWDHAVGPLQFIPSSWERWGADGDDDGVADPNDLDDAAYTAARYLCADGHDLTTGAGWADAVFGYNHDQSYVDAVYGAATSYADRSQ